MGVEWSLRRRTRAWRALRRAPHLLIAHVQNGASARITGTVSAIANERTSPVEGTPCVGFRLEIARREGRGQTIVMRREECDPFAIGDETGKATVEGLVLFALDWERDWSELPESGYALLEAAGVITEGIFFRRRFIYREALLEPGDRVSACGLAFLEPDPTQPAVDMREPALRPHLRGSRQERVAVVDAADLEGAA